MKRALAGVLAIALVGLLAHGATAQVSFFQVYFDDASNGTYGETQAYCGQPGATANLYLVGQNFNTQVIGLEYQVYFPQALLYTSDKFPVVFGGTLVFGNSHDGASVGYGLPRNGFSPLLISTIGVYWTALCDCAVGPQAIVVGPHPGSGFNSPDFVQYPDFVILPAELRNPDFVQYPDFVILPAVGMTSLICLGPVATEETTWGGVKALYR